MHLEDQLVKKYTSTGEEVHHNKLALRFRSFKSLSVQVFGKENTIEYAANMKTASFMMDHFNNFVEAALDYMIRNGFIRAISNLDKEIGITFDAFNMSFQGQIVDCALCFGEKKFTDRLTMKKQMHYVYIHFRRNASGFIDYKNSLSFGYAMQKTVDR